MSVFFFLHQVQIILRFLKLLRPLKFSDINLKITSVPAALNAKRAKRITYFNNKYIFGNFRFPTMFSKFLKTAG